MNAVLATMLDQESSEFVITHVEMIKVVSGCLVKAGAGALWGQATRLLETTVMGQARTGNDVSILRCAFHYEATWRC